MLRSLGLLPQFYSSHTTSTLQRILQNGAKKAITISSLRGSRKLQVVISGNGSASSNGGGVSVSTGTSSGFAIVPGEENGATFSMTFTDNGGGNFNYNNEDSINMSTDGDADINVDRIPGTGDSDVDNGDADNADMDVDMDVDADVDADTGNTDGDTETNEPGDEADADADNADGPTDTNEQGDEADASDAPNTDRVPGESVLDLVSDAFGVNYDRLPNGSVPSGGGGESSTAQDENQNPPCEPADNTGDNTDAFQLPLFVVGANADPGMAYSDQFREWLESLVPKTNSPVDLGRDIDSDEYFEWLKSQGFLGGDPSFQPLPDNEP